MTSQPDPPATDRTLESEVASDPDVIIVAGEVIEEDPDGDDLDSAGPDSADPGENVATDGPDLVVAEATGGSPGGDRTTGDNGRLAGLGEQWHDIQALFVDDPRGSVRASRGRRRCGGHRAASDVAPATVRACAGGQHIG